MGWQDRRKYKGKPARPVTDDEYFGWIEIDEPSRKRKPLVTREDMLAYLRRKNRVRVRRMRSDFRWAQRMLLKAGVDPEEVRFIL